MFTEVSFAFSIAGEKFKQLFKKLRYKNPLRFCYYFVTVQPGTAMSVT